MADRDPPVRLSFAVMTHARRAHLAQALAMALPGPMQVVTDPDPDGWPSPLRTATAAWSWCAPDATHHLVLQDDVLLTDSFAELAMRAAARYPHHLVGLYANATSWNGAAARVALLAGFGWITPLATEYFPTLATIMPCPVAHEFASYAATRTGLAVNDDETLASFAAKSGIRTVLRVPSLVEHGTEPSLTGHAYQGPRHSVAFSGTAQPPGSLPHLPGHIALPALIQRRALLHLPGPDGAGWHSLTRPAHLALIRRAWPEVRWYADRMAAGKHPERAAAANRYCREVSLAAMSLGWAVARLCARHGTTPLGDPWPELVLRRYIESGLSSERAQARWSGRHEALLALAGEAYLSGAAAMNKENYCNHASSIASRPSGADLDFSLLARLTIRKREQEMPQSWAPSHQLGVGSLQISRRARQYVNAVLDSGRLSYGPMSKRFEDTFAELHGREFGILANSGTSALHVALAAMADVNGWRPGDQVIVPAVTFVASANAVLHAGLEPVFADVDPRTYAVDPQRIPDVITNRTRAIMPVHLCGLPADMPAVMKVAEAYGLRVIEDACETGFVGVAGRPVGSYGDAACFSTYAAHLIVTGVGGMTITGDRDLAIIMRSLCNHGRDPAYLAIDDDADLSGPELEQVVQRRFQFTRLGFSYRMTELEAALGIAALETRLDMLARRKRNAGLLTAGLGDLAEREILQLPETPPGAEHAFMMYPIVVAADGVRDDLVLYLEAAGIETRPLMPLINQPVYTQRYGSLEERYPVARHLNSHAFYIGCHQEFGPHEISYICDTINSYF